jgi:hypothetical protein
VLVHVQQQPTAAGVTVLTLLKVAGIGQSIFVPSELKATHMKIENLKDPPTV